jgi:hypothetical protein
MHDEPPPPISPAEHRARLARVKAIASGLGFVGAVEYRHVSNNSGGAQYGMGSSIKGDLLLVYPEAFRRDSDPDDFSLEAIIAHERGHQLICRHERLRRNTPVGMSAVTEEVLASLVGAVIVSDPGAGQALVLKAIFTLGERGMQPEEASRRVEDILSYLGTIL